MGAWSSDVCSSGLQPLGKVGPLAQLRHSHVDAAGAGVEVPVPVAVTAVLPPRRDGAVIGAADRIGLGREQGVDEGLQRPEARRLGKELLSWCRLRWSPEQ